MRAKTYTYTVQNHAATVDNQKVWKTMMQSYHHVAATDGAQETDELEVRLGE